MKPTRESLDYPYYPRARHGRGSKEAKRRRDARRNRRKLQAVQALDAQLCRDVEKTLSQARISPPRNSNLPTPVPVQSPVSIPVPSPAHVTQTQPQLPYFNFGGLDLIGDCPQLIPSKVDSGYWSPSLLTPTFPSWCPELPSFSSFSSGKNTKWSEFPLFFDLSKLPEPTYSPKWDSTGRELQLWRPQPTPPPLPKKQSRFFQSTGSPKPTVKLPPTACKLHADDDGIDERTQPKPKTVAESLDQVVRAAETARKLKCEQSDKNAANLWEILTSDEYLIRGDDNDLYPCDLSHQPLDDLYLAPCGVYDHRLESVGMPYELDDTEIPYVHSNSLTGHANERGSEKFPTSEEDVTLFEAPTNLACIEDFLGGLNEMVMDPYTDEGYTDALLAVLNLPPLPTSPDLEDTAPLTTDPRRIDSFMVADRGTQTELDTSDAHFKSEQALFHPQSFTPRTPDEDLVDVATFLKMGHAGNCWCNDCGEPPAILSNERFAEDNGWMVYSPVDEQTWPSWSVPTTPDDGSVSSAWEWEWGTIVHDEKQKVESALPPYTPSWDKALPCQQSCLAHGAW